jgi:hypothetical protein
VTWLRGPTGGVTIGDRPYEEIARAERLSIERLATTGGLLPDFEVTRERQLRSRTSRREDPGLLREHGPLSPRHVGHDLFPARIALWLLVATISRRAQQLDLPLDGLDTARGITSEIILLRDSTGAVRYTRWFRRRVHDGRVLFTGFYMTQRIPRNGLPCVKGFAARTSVQRCESIDLAVAASRVGSLTRRQPADQRRWAG